jgi:endonuclease YncB( thermonuclease family)
LSPRSAAGVALATAIAVAASAGSFFDARVLRIVDGDTLEVVTAGGDHQRIRLADIDAPERGQPWSRRAREALTARVAGKPVRINRVATDVYGRTVGEVYADDVCVGCELVREGHAWAYRGHEPDPLMLELEAEARAAGRGLWALPESERTPPWEWRRAGQHDRAPAAPAAPRAEGCGDKHRCAQMRDCAEARFYLSECGVDTLDGDGDGTPCEALCREAGAR